MTNKYVRKLYCPILTCPHFMGCSNFDETTFFWNPIIPQQREEWVREISKYQKIEGNFRLCQLHFEEKYLKFVNGSRKAKLLPNAVPTIFVTNPYIENSRVAVDHVDEPLIKIETEEYQTDTILVENYSPPLDFRRQKTEENPEIFHAKEIPCNKCIYMDVKIQGQQVKINKLQNTIKSLRNELARYKYKVEQLAKNQPIEQLNKCPVCRQKSSDENHICDGRKEISCDYCGATFNSTAELVDHLSVLHEQKQFYNCDKCQRVYSMDLLLQFHKKWHRDGEPLVACDACDTKFYTQHQLNIHKNESHREINAVASVIAKPFQCGKCGKSFAEALDLDKHIKIHDSKALGTFECFICKVKLKTLAATRIHLRNLHQRAKKCTICNENLTSIELGEHMCGGLREMKCVYCKKSFKAMKDLLQHLKEDCRIEQLIYRCDMCSKYYPMKILKDIHAKHGHSAEHLSKPHTCDECPKRFVTKLRLQVHKRRHRLTRDYLCDECGKGFTCNQDLEKHKLSHIARDHECEQCGEIFPTKDRLRRHRSRIHERNKYVCDICNKIVLSRARLLIHKKIHTRTEADRKYACPICPLKFFDGKHLRSHRRFVHSTERPFECEICKSTYKHKGDLVKHKRSLHATH